MPLVRSTAAGETCSRSAGGGRAFGAVRSQSRGLHHVTMRIETTSDGQTVVLRLIGRIESMYLDELQAQVRRHRLPLVLDLDQVTLVDQWVVRFLMACEAGASSWCIARRTSGSG